MSGGSKRHDTAVPPEGYGPTLFIRFPAKVHLAAALLAGALGLVWHFCGQDALKNVLGILAAMAALYSGFYARTAILSARERERRFETIKFSNTFSDALHIAARHAISNRFGQILNQQTLGSDGEKRAAAVAIMSAELRQSLKARESHTPPGATAAAAGTGKDLIDDAMLILDYFEDLAFGIEDGVLDGETARKLLRSPLMSFWELLRGLVEQYRVRGGRTTLYEGMEGMYKTWPKV